MKITVFTHVTHWENGNRYYAYNPYVREMNVWFRNFDEVEVIAPLKFSYNSKPENALQAAYQHPNISLTRIPSFNLLSLKDIIVSIFKVPVISKEILSAMRRADHLHIRCPGNIGLISSILQVFFPNKKKTFKYAGNWDNDPKQPWSYKLQKRILANEWITRNAKVLVYGNWPNQSRNILPFFTSSFSNSDIEEVKKNITSPYSFLFVGSLSKGKRPHIAIEIIHTLKKMGYLVKLDVYGDGELLKDLQTYIRNNELKSEITLHGNKDSKIIKEAYINAHFSILPSKSEGWPKALAEAMFFGCVPISTAISCVPWMLGNGERGILIEPDVKQATEKISYFLSLPSELKSKSKKAQKWAQHYTLEKFSSEIKKFL
jgi:glycosyltransferase involved in cell wall biosynthesis